MTGSEALTAGAQRPYSRPAGATEILLVRHGAYVMDGSPAAEATLKGQADPPLTHEGHRQAELLAERLSALSIDRVFTSSLQRTKQTAQPYLTRTGLTALELEDLREVHLGDFDGAEFERRRAAGDPRILAVFEHQKWDLIPNAEPMEEFVKRVVRGIDQVSEHTGPDATAVAFVHGAVIAALCAQVTGSAPLAHIAAENGSITTLLRFTSGGWQLRKFNDTAHLSL